MKITAIKQQVKRTDRYSLYVDEAYSFSLGEDALIKSGLHSGLEITSQQLEALKQLSFDDTLYNRALRYVALRPRTVWEVVSYLQRKQAAPEVAASIIERLRGLGLLDDAAYAVSFVRDRQLLRPTSRRRLELELKKRHVDSELIGAALHANELDERCSLTAVIAKKRRQTKYQDDQKLMQYLARQGFSYDDIKRSLASEEY